VKSGVGLLDQANTCLIHFYKEHRQDFVELLKDEIGLDPSVHDNTNALKDITISSDNEVYITID
jgi:hypothetical protein